MSQSFPQVQVEGRTAVFSGEVRPSTREDAGEGETFTIWQLGSVSVNGGPALRISATCDSDRSIRSAASRLAKNGNTYLTKRVAPALVSEQVDSGTMEFTATIELSVPGFESPKVLDMRTQTKLPRSAYGFLNKVRLAERAAAQLCWPTCSSAWRGTCTSRSPKLTQSPTSRSSSSLTGRRRCRLSRLIYAKEGGGDWSPPPSFS